MPTGRILMQKDLIEKLEKYEDLVETTVDHTYPGHKAKLLPDLDGDLAALREELNDVVDQLDAEHRRVGEDLGLELDKKLHLENHQVYNYCLRVTKAVSLL